MRSVIDTQPSLIAGPILEPLDLEEVKKCLRFGSTTEDTLIDLWISAARQDFEDQTGRQLMTATWALWLDAFPDTGEIELPKPPLQSVVSVIADGVGTFDPASYLVRAPQGPTCERGRVSLVNGASWPTATVQPKAVQIQYTAGYGDAPGDVPEIIRGALLNLVALSHRYRGSEDKPSMSVEAICRRFRLASFATVSPRTTVTV